MSASSVHDTAEKRGKQQLQVPQQLDTRLLASPSEFRLGVRGSKVALQHPHLKVRGIKNPVWCTAPQLSVKHLSDFESDQSDSGLHKLHFT